MLLERTGGDNQTVVGESAQNAERASVRPRSPTVRSRGSEAALGWLARTGKMASLQYHDYGASAARQTSQRCGLRKLRVTQTVEEGLTADDP